MSKIIKWGLYLVSWAVLVYATKDLSIVLYYMVMFSALGLFVSGAIND